jgi:lysophospholipase L1-like esterase
VDLLPTVKYPSTGTLTVRLAQDASNYYELTNYTNSTPGFFIKVVGGQVVGTVPFSSRYYQNIPYNVTIDFSAGVVVVSAYGQLFALEQNATPLTITRFEIEAYQQDVYFDNVSYSEFVEHEPSVDLIKPVAGLFQTSSTLRVEATSLLLEPGWRVVFAIDAGSASEILAEDASAPYVVDVVDVPEGIHSVDVYVVDAGGNQVIGAGLTDHVSNVSIGDYYVAVGDSITKGTGDNFSADNVSADGRNSGGGFEPILNDRLTSLTGYSHTVKNQGVGGRTSAGGVSKIAGYLGSHPDAQFFLVMFGTNDSAEDLAMPSGLGLLPGNPGYSGSYKANMQGIVSAVLASGKLPILAKPPIAYGSCSRCTKYLNPEAEPRNALIREYHAVIDELVLENALPIEGPNLYPHFAAHPEQMADRLHPNGVGYQAIAELWAEALLGP